MEAKTLTIKYKEYPGLSSLPIALRQLLEAALTAARGAYAPYSHFHVGAAIRLDDGSIVCGNNQENSAYPSGLCAERTALFAASAQNPSKRNFESMAIVGINADGQRCEASPCGACRQVMAEYEQRQQHPMQVVCYVNESCIRVFGSVADLLPFGFQF